MTSLLVAASLAAIPLQTVQYPSGADTVSGLLATPSTKGRHPGVIVVHEYWGLNDFAKAKTRELAEQGYVALAIDLYRGPVATDPDTAHQLARGLPEDRAKRDLAAAFSYLASRPDVEADRIATIGWCMGGGYALEEALQEPRLAAAVIYYGRLPTDQKAIAGIKAQLLGNYGTEDKGIPPAAVENFVNQAKAAGVIVDFKEYPGAGHAFASNPDPKVFRSDAARDAARRSTDFLKRVLSSAPATAK
jgi:carboxymethylenebutenolidase